MKRRYRRNLRVLIVIIILAIYLLIYHYITGLNKIYDIEDSNSFKWQKYMNEEEYEQLEKGMSYMDVVMVAKGDGKEISEEVFIWNDEILMTQAYEIHFKDNKLIDKKIIEKRGYSKR